VSDGTWLLSACNSYYLRSEPTPVEVSGGQAVDGVMLSLTRGAILCGNVQGERRIGVWAYPLDGQGETLHTEALARPAEPGSFPPPRGISDFAPRDRHSCLGKEYVFKCLAPGRWRVVVSRCVEECGKSADPTTIPEPVQHLSLERTITIVGDEFVELDFPAPPVAPEEP
jgi:hypothetical protein